MLLLFGKLYVNLKRWKEAYHIFKQAWENQLKVNRMATEMGKTMTDNDETSKNIHLNIGISAMKTNQLEESDRELNKCLEYDGNQEITAMELAKLARLQNNSTLYWNRLKSMVESFPNNEQAILLYSDVCIFKQSHKEALEKLQHFCKNNETQTKTILAWLKVSYFADDTKQAITWYIAHSVFFYKHTYNTHCIREKEIFSNFCFSFVSFKIIFGFLRMCVIQVFVV